MVTSQVQSLFDNFYLQWAEERRGWVPWVWFCWSILQVTQQEDDGPCHHYSHQAHVGYTDIILDIQITFWIFRQHSGYSDNILDIQTTFWIFRQHSGYTDIILDIQTTFWIFRQHSGYSDNILDVQTTFWVYKQHIFRFQVTKGATRIIKIVRFILKSTVKILKNEFISFDPVLNSYLNEKLVN